MTLPMYLDTSAIVGAKIETNDTGSFQETEFYDKFNLFS